MAQLRSSTMELVNLIEWGIFRLYTPSMGSWLRSYEAIKGGTDMERKIRRLEAKGIIKEIGHGSEWAYLLAEDGRSDGRHRQNPEKEWARKWDGQWSLLSFDLPGKNSKLRKRLMNWLREERFGHLQDSLWISPFPVNNLVKVLHGLEIDPLGFVLFRGRDEFQLLEEEAVSLAWNFGEINRLYAEHLEILKQIQKGLASESVKGEQWISLFCKEKELYSAASFQDPFLPEKLLPSDYLGKKAWELRKKLQRQIEKY